MGNVFGFGRLGYEIKQKVFTIHGAYFMRYFSLMRTYLERLHEIDVSATPSPRSGIGEG